MLTDVQVKRARAGEKDVKLTDGGGLYLFVTTKGGKSWRMKYRLAKKEKLLTFGSYPAVSLFEARRERDAAKAQLRAGADPAIEKKKRVAARHSDAENRFDTVARAWHALNARRWSATHADDVLASLEKDLFPDIGVLPIKEVTEAILLEALRKVERRGAVETAKRIRQRASEVFAYAAAAGMRTGDPAAVIQSLMVPSPKKGRQPALTRLDDVRQLLRDTEAAEASAITKLAHRLLALTAVRSAVQCAARWEQFEGLDGPAPLWRIPPAAMKLKLGKKDDEEFEHLVPLSRQAVEVVEAVRPLTGHLPYLFPNERHAHRPMSSNGVRSLIIRAAGGRYLHRHCPHGWRTSFSTIMNEWRRRDGRPDDREVINLMLAHVVEDKVEGAYNRAAHMDRRIELAQIWADTLLDGMPEAASLLAGRRR